MTQLRTGIIVYPGSNCIDETRRYFPNSFYIWHNESEMIERMDLLVVPGGFAFGDREYDKATENYTINPGKKATECKATEIIFKAIEKRIPVVGICNGFQILIKLGLLPGSLNLSKNEKFTCMSVNCKLDGVFKERNVSNEDQLELDVANSFGRYEVSEEEYNTMNRNGQVILRYEDKSYQSMNGSFENIAGVCDENHLVFGMMPHPERNNFHSKIRDILLQIIETPQELYTCRRLFKTEVKSLMNSEHISYKSTRKYLKNLYTTGPFVVQGPGENAGLVDIGNGYAIAIRIESHNHPVFIDPFNGAATGVGGIIRDIFTMGARPIALLDFLRFGKDQNSEYLLKESVRGISYYGNCIGIPNIGGDCFREDTYEKNPLLNVACIGLVKKHNIVYGNVTSDGELLVYVGKKTGNDGINGAKMASGVFTSTTDVEDLKSNIQKGDSFLEKLLLEACVEISNRNLVEGMQDMGAGGLLCSSVEMIQRGRHKYGKNFGCQINADAVPTCENVNSCHRLISESQERMLLSVRMQNWKKVCEVFEAWDLEYKWIGTVNTGGKYVIVNDKNEVLYSEYMKDFDDPTLDWELNKEYKLDHSRPSRILEPDNTRWLNYDSTVGGRTLKTGRGEDNFSKLEIYETKKTLGVTWGEDFQTCYDRLTKEGGEPLGLVNCLNYGHPKNSLGDLSSFLEDLTKQCRKYKVPVLGGNVSLYNATDEDSVFPTPILVMIGLIN